jgi:hypothetical protein
MPRRVKIETVYRSDGSPRTYFVRYLDRRKFQKHLAAQFDASVTTVAQVIEYVNQRDDLRLVDIDTTTGVFESTDTVTPY